jgi:hypothetical protein
MASSSIQFDVKADKITIKDDASDWFTSQIVPLDEAEANIADTNANVEDAVRKPTWRDKLALKKAHQAEQNRIL